MFRVWGLGFRELQYKGSGASDMGGSLDIWESKGSRGPHESL